MITKYLLEPLTNLVNIFCPHDSIHPCDWTEGAPRLSVPQHCLARGFSFAGLTWANVGRYGGCAKRKNVSFSHSIRLAPR